MSSTGTRETAPLCTNCRTYLISYPASIRQCPHCSSTLILSPRSK